ncbi:hypothetical protein KEM55_005592, partial [Ascosphaera atra]
NLVSQRNPSGSSARRQQPLQVVVGVINGFMNGDVDVRGYYDRVAQGVEWQRLGYDGGDARGGQGQVPLRNWWRL